MNHIDIITALEHRYAVNAFDTTKKVSDEDIKTILESARLAPSSYGLEPWKFILVQNPDVRQKIREVGYGQSKITDASHLVVIAYRKDGESVVSELIARTAVVQGKTPEELSGFQQMIHSAMNSRSNEARDAWLKAQSYIPLGIMIETAALLGVDTGPMEGFDPTKVDEILGLVDQHLNAATMLAIGYRSQDSDRPKVRRAYDEVVEVIA